MFDKKGKKRTRNPEGTTWLISLVNVYCKFTVLYKQFTFFLIDGRNWKFALIFSNIYGIWPSKYKSKAGFLFMPGRVKVFQVRLKNSKWMS